MAENLFPDFDAALQGTHVYNQRLVRRIASIDDRCRVIKDNIAIIGYEEDDHMPVKSKVAAKRHLESCAPCGIQYAVLSQLDLAISCYQDNEILTADQRGGLEAHLHKCSGCTTSYKGFTHVTKIARKALEEPPSQAQ